jgi:hypothetical protein
MKRLLLVLLVLGLSVPAIADVFVYNVKQSGVKLYYDETANNDEGAWVQSKPSGTTYVVIQVTDSSSAESVDVWTIDTWTEKVKEEDENGRMTTVTYKYYTVYGPDSVNFIETPIAKKNMWIAEGTLESGDNSACFMVSGQTKSTKIGSQTYTVAAALSGYSIFGDVSSQDVGGGTVSFTLNSKITKELVSSDDDVEVAISDYFETVLGYEAY